jgi:hypothetical protein
MALAKETSDHLWLPEFWDAGYYDPQHREKTPFAPFVWAPQAYGLGIDIGDEIAAKGTLARPRLGLDLTKLLRSVNETSNGFWRAGDGRLALRSEVWGSWKPNPDDTRRRHLSPEVQLPLRGEPERRVDPGKRRVGLDTFCRPLRDAGTEHFGVAIEQLDLAHGLVGSSPVPFPPLDESEPARAGAAEIKGADDRNAKRQNEKRRLLRE